MISFFTILVKNYNKYYDNIAKNELKKNIKPISNKNIDHSNEGKLVLINGKIKYNNEILYDDLFGISAKAPRLLRYVEVYQWEQHEEINNNGKTVYKYDKVWSNDIIKSKDFKKKGHSNITKKNIETKFYTHDTIKIGKFKLSKKQKNNIACNVQIRLGSNMSIPIKDFKIYDNFFMNSKDPLNPEIGDYRISYYYSDWENVTILASQHNDTFTDYITKKKERINYINNGKLNKFEIIDLIIPSS